MERANKSIAEGRYVHQIDTKSKSAGQSAAPPGNERTGKGAHSAGYRPGRSGARRRKR
jgi:hypothetical protein